MKFFLFVFFGRKEEEEHSVHVAPPHPTNHLPQHSVSCFLSPARPADSFPLGVMLSLSLPACTHCPVNICTKWRKMKKKAKKCSFFLFSPPEHSSPFSANEVDVTKRWSSTHSDCAKWNRGVCLENTQSGIPVRRPKGANIHLKRI